jgi:phosphatidylinositol alpha-1,6-mannosyltransferase
MTHSSLKEILFISHKYPPSTGGMQKYSYELINGFKKEKDLIVHSLVYDGSISVLSWFWNLKKNVTILFKANPSIQLVHVNDALMAYFCRWIKKKYNVHVVATFHGLDVVFPFSMYQKRIIPNFNLQYDAFICVSKATAEASIQRGIDRAKTHVILNGVDHTIAEESCSEDRVTQVFESIGVKNHSEKKIVVGLGRGVKRKGYGWFVNQVLPKLQDDIIFIMLGPRSFYEKYEPILKILLPNKIKHNIELLLGLSTDDFALRQALKNKILLERYFRPGYMKFADILCILRNSDLFIMPNLKVMDDMEGFGLVALEASLCGKFVLVSGIDGITDAIIPEANGMHIESENSQIWINTIHELTSSKAKLASRGLKGKEFTLSNYSWLKMIAEYRQFFEKLSELKQ